MTCQIITKYPAIFHNKKLEDFESVKFPWTDPSYSARQRADHYFHPAWKLGWCAGGGNGPVGWAVVDQVGDIVTVKRRPLQHGRLQRVHAWHGLQVRGWLSLLDVLESFAGVLLLRSSFSIWGNCPKNVGGSWHFPSLQTESSHVPSFQRPSILVYSSSLSFWRESKEGGQEIDTIYPTIYWAWKLNMEHRTRTSLGEKHVSFWS